MKLRFSFANIAIFSHFDKELSISPYNLELILGQLADMNLIELNEYIGGCLVGVTADTHDFIRRGGFTVQEAILKNSIEKLDLEIRLLSKELEPKYLDKLEKISSLGANIMGALKFFS